MEYISGLKDSTRQTEERKKNSLRKRWVESMIKKYK